MIPLYKNYQIFNNFWAEQTSKKRTSTSGLVVANLESSDQGISEFDFLVKKYDKDLSDDDDDNDDDEHGLLWGEGWTRAREMMMMMTPQK